VKLTALDSQNAMTDKEDQDKKAKVDVENWSTRFFKTVKPGIERVQALANISRSALLS